MSLRVDVHQHLWSPPLVEALRRRRTPPRLDGWRLHLTGEPPFDVDPADHDVDSRAALVREDGLDRALVSLSSPLGIEMLPPAEARPLLDAYHEGAAALPGAFGAWAAATVSEIDPAALAHTLDASGSRFAGVQLPAAALADPAALERSSPLLDVVEARDLPLLIHPGPARTPTPAPLNAPPSPPGPPRQDTSGQGTPGQEAPAHGAPGQGAPSQGAFSQGVSGGVADGMPGWWAAVVPYVQEMHAAWFAFRAFGRARHPRLRVCFTMLAGLAPLHGERVAARGGGRGTVDPLVFVETSSYGPRAADAVVRALGVDAIVHGSDRPYARPRDLHLGEAAEHAFRVRNPHLLLFGKEPTRVA
ncbi:amidohydrolase family protein [Actinomadura fibrosa]|uniref:Amidohydrolase family protein n=1 Tax=Actinomadura fibrosa TaxID=111802 RepID=A0ABW2XB34_9ACTN|nr:amidohydrolase family protein [Actinomadura fibrosa]